VKQLGSEEYVNSNGIQTTEDKGARGCYTIEECEVATDLGGNACFGNKEAVVPSSRAQIEGEYGVIREGDLLPAPSSKSSWTRQTRRWKCIDFIAIVKYYIILSRPKNSLCELGQTSGICSVPFTGLQSSSRRIPCVRRLE